jgi:hypothetical protein
MYRLVKTKLDTGIEHWLLRTLDDEPVSFREVLSQWRTSEQFRDFWARSLRAVPFTAYCWECRPVTDQDLDQAFECVFVESPLLVGRAADWRPFEAHFRGDRDAVSFESLGKDAILVSPCPGEGGGDFAHLSSFMSTATERRVSALWHAVGDALEARISSHPVWLSTAGLGVSWLHVRLDSRPKYYRHAPYKLPRSV